MSLEFSTQPLHRHTPAQDRALSRVLVLGFSVRSAAEATSATGVHVTAFDHFGDSDTRAASDCYSQWDFSSLPEQERPISAILSERLGELLSRQAPFDAVIFAGGCENHAEIVGRLREHSPRAIGIPTGSELTRIRDWRLWRSICDNSSICFPTTYGIEEIEAASLVEEAPCGHAQPKELAREWLVKRPSGGGLGIQWLDDSELSKRKAFFPNKSDGFVRSRSRKTSGRGTKAPNSCESGYQECFTAFPGGGYIQRFVRGRGIGVTGIVTPSCSKILGCTEEINSDEIQTIAPSAYPFLFSGCLGPCELSLQQRSGILSLLRIVQQEVGWLGWLQMDFIEDEAGQLWLLEINPRWTSGMELLNLAGCNPVSAHLGALGGLAIDEQPDKSQSTRLFAKQIYYAPVDLSAAVVRSAAMRLNALHADGLAPCADIPSAELVADGSPKIPSGHPALTLRVEIAKPAGKEVSSFSRTALINALAELRNTFEHEIAQVQ